MSAITVYNTASFLAIQCTPLMSEEDETQVLSWLGVSPEDLDISEMKASFYWCVWNPRTESPTLIDPANFLSWETAQQWDDSARAALDAIHSEVESWPEDTYQREFLLHIIAKRGGDLPKAAGQTSQQFADEILANKISEMISEFEDLAGMAFDADDTSGSDGVEAAKQRFMQVFNVTEGN